MFKFTNSSFIRSYCKIKYFYNSLLLINCTISSSVRETWIKTKYVERQFVKQLSVPSSQQNSPDHRSSRSSQLSVRKWSVRKLRRRPRSRDSKGKLNVQRSEETLPSVLEPSVEPASLVNAEVLAFGKTLEKQTLDGSIQLDSDQDSTGGEEDEFIGNVFY